MRIPLPEEFVYSLDNEDDAIFGGSGIQVKVARDLLPLLEKAGVNIDEPIFENPKPSDLLHWIIKQYPSPHQWRIMRRADGSFHFNHLVKYWGNQDHDLCSLHTVPLEPFLERLSGNLHGIVFSMVSLFGKKTGVGNMSLEIDYESMLFEWLSERENYDGEDVDDRIIKAMDYYKHGKPMLYAKALVDHATSVAEIKELIERFKAVTAAEHRIIEWVEDGLSLIESPYNLFSFDLHQEDLAPWGEDDMEEGPVPYTYMRFVWSDRDLIWDELYDTINGEYQTNGCSIPMCHVFEDPSEVEPTWPVELGEFMMEGIHIAHQEILDDWEE